jgi:hypothetical protein
MPTQPQDTTAWLAGSAVSREKDGAELAAWQGDHLPAQTLASLDDVSPRSWGLADWHRADFYSGYALLALGNPSMGRLVLEASA